MFKALSLLIFGNIFSKLLGVAREILFASLFGVGVVATGYRIAYSAFFLPINALVGDTLSAALIPFYRRSIAADAHREREFLVAVALLGAVISAFIMGALLVFSIPISSFIAGRANASAVLISSNMIRLMALASPLYILGTIGGYLDTVHGNYSSVSIRPSLLNFCSLFAALAAYYLHSTDVLAFGIIAGSATFAFAALRTYRKTLLQGPPIQWAEVNRILMRLVGSLAPLLVIPLASQTCAFLERVIAARIGSGVLPAVDYGRFIAETLTGVTAIPLSLLTMARHGGSVSGSSHTEFKNTALALLVLTIPISSILVVDSQPVIALVFARGAFKAEAVSLTSQVVSGLAIGLPLTIAGYYTLKTMSAQMSNGAAALITIAAAIVNIAFDFAAYQHLGPLAIGLGASIYGIVIFGLSTLFLRLWAGTMLPLTFTLLVYAIGCGLMCASSSWGIRSLILHAGISCLMVATLLIIHPTLLKPIAFRVRKIVTRSATV
jgi:putative peptidoglycan lipid II flippase